jgi:hypothetical protein
VAQIDADVGRDLLISILLIPSALGGGLARRERLLIMVKYNKDYCFIEK